MDLDHTSPIILNKFYLQPLFKDGVYGMLYYFDFHMSKLTTNRCTAPPENLSQRGSMLRFCEHTAAAIQALTHKELWDEYGIIGDVTVSCNNILSDTIILIVFDSSRLLTGFPVLISMNSFRRTSSTKSSKGYLKTTSLRGSRSILLGSMERQWARRLWMKLTVGKLFC